MKSVSISFKAVIKRCGRAFDAVYYWRTAYAWLPDCQGIGEKEQRLFQA